MSKEIQDFIKNVAGLDLYAVAHMSPDALRATLLEYHAEAIELQNTIVNKSNREYVVVMHAGYESEREIRRFKSQHSAYGWIDLNYSEQQKAALHIAVCAEQNGKRSYDI